MKTVLVLFLVVALSFAFESSLQLFFSPIEQCAPLTIHLRSTPNHSQLPLSLYILPFNASQPLSIPLPNDPVTQKSVAISFLPFPAGTTFIATLLNSTDSPFGSVSDITPIQASPIADSSCLSPPDTAQPSQLFTLQNPLTQCEPFNVTYDTSVVSQPPIVRAFTPLGKSILLNQTAQPAQDTATYIMNAEHGEVVLLLFDDLQGHRQTSSLLTVGLDPSTGDTCTTANLLPSQMTNSDPTDPAPSSPLTLSKANIIIIAGSTGAVLILALLFVAIYIIRDRRRRHAAHFLSRLTKVSKKIGSVPPPRPSRNAIPPLFTPTHKSIPPYIRFGEDDEDEMPPLPVNNVDRPHPRPWNGPSAVDNSSVTSFDIEEILDSATIYQGMSDNPFRPSNVSFSFPAPPPAAPTTTRLVPPSMEPHVPSYLSATSQPQSIPTMLFAGGSGLGGGSNLSLPHGVGPEHERLSYMSDVRVRPAIPPQLYTVVQEGSLASSPSSQAAFPGPSAPTGDEQLDPSWYGIAS